MSRHDEFGKEHLDPTPVSVPAGWQRPPTMEELIRRHIRQEMSRQAADQGEETFEEADDFEVDEDPDPLSPYEIPEAPQEWPGGVKPVDPAPPPQPGEKIAPEPATQAAEALLKEKQRGNPADELQGSLSESEVLAGRKRS